MHNEPQIKGALRIFSFARISVWVHWSWLILALFFFQSDRGFSSPIWNLVVLVGLFGIVLLHEFGHALATRSVGGLAQTIMLWPLGGVAFVRPPFRPGATLWSIAAGPLVNVILAPLLFGLLEAARAGIFPASDDAIRALFQLAFANIIVLVFNCLPIYPLDGGQIVQSLLWFVIGWSRSMRIAAGFGLIAAAGVAGLAIAYWDIFLLLIAAFVAWQAWGGFQHATRLAKVDERILEQAYSPPPRHATEP